MMYRSSTLLVLLLSCLASGAHAQRSTPNADASESRDETDDAAGPPASSDPRKLFQAGHDAYSAGHFEVALELFERSYALSKRHELLYDIALAHDRLRHDQEAVDAYERFLDLAHDPEHREAATARLKVLREAIARNERPEPTVVPAIAPEDAAQTMQKDDASLSDRWSDRDADARDEESPGVLSTWWFWTAVGTVVIGGAAVGTWALLREQDDPASGPMPNTGVSIATLSLDR